ncbi:MAG TPA: hypothetical protein VFG15_20525 [Amycolatopsis sp.]|nr:hypothetical protein [Amycolatopsis sp.]
MNDIEIPVYFDFYHSTYRVDTTPDGSLAGYLLNLRTGRIDEDNSRIRTVLHAREEDIEVVGEDRYVELTEARRAHHLRGDGPIFALYETIQAIHDAADQASRPLEPAEDAMIRVTRARTFRMWEQEFARRDAGEPPSFRFWSLNSG